MSRVGGERSVEGLLLDWSMELPLPDRRLPVSLLSKAQKAAELQRVQARRAMDAAYEAELVMGLADDTPGTLDLLPVPQPPPTQDLRTGLGFRMDPDGTLHVATPSGITRTTRPPGLRPHEPPGSASKAGIGPPPAPADDEPPPF